MRRAAVPLGKNPDSIGRIADKQKILSGIEVSEFRFVFEELGATIGHDNMIEATSPGLTNAMDLLLDA